MPTYLSPGVYVEEVPSQSKPIEGVGTAVAAFVGLAPGGPVNKPMRVVNWTQFAKLYGDPAEPANGPYVEGGYLGHAVRGFFENGGTICWVVRIGDAGDAPAAQALLPAAVGDGEMIRAIAKNGADGVTVEIAEEPGKGGGDGDDGDSDQPASYKVIITAGSQREEFDGLTLKKGRSNVVTKVNAASKLIKLEDTSASLPEAARALKVGTYKLNLPTIPAGEIEPGHFTGDVAKREGIGSLAAIDEVTMVCAPDVMMFANNGSAHAIRDLQAKLVAHCEGAGDRLAILDTPPGLLPQDALDWRMDGGPDSKMAALYYPWLEVSDPLSGGPMLVPPCGHIAGVWARTDATRGVHKAPANETILGITGLGFGVTQDEQGQLNRSGLNCIRSFPGRGIRIWGARTLSSDPEWRYVPVRRLFNYVCESIMQGTQWAVFEPNDERLWTQLRIAIGNFLQRTWSEGALFGATPDQAFFVKCDSETNPEEVIEAGQVVCEIGIAPVKPAEFVIFRISQYAAGADAAATE